MSQSFAERFPAAAANKPSAEDLDAHAAEQKAVGATAPPKMAHISEISDWPSGSEVVLAGDAVADSISSTFGEQGTDMNPATGCISNEGLALRNGLPYEDITKTTREFLENSVAAVEPASAPKPDSIKEPFQFVAKPEPTKEQLQKLADEFKQKFGSHNGLRTLPNGSIVVEVVIDVDLAGSLIAWAEGAGENVSDYIQKQVGEALLSYMGG